jgi:ribosome biogenesis protein BRX1
MEKQNRRVPKRQKLSEGSNEKDGSNEKESGGAVVAEKSPLLSDGRYRNKQRCLVLCSRGVTARYRHLLEDLRTLMPHHKKESKLDFGKEGMGEAVSDIAEMRGCNTVLMLECRKRQDAYMWIGRVGGGPTARFHVTNIHTMDELRLTGNCMKGSRPLLSFDESFDRLGHLKLLKELFEETFGVPRGHPKSKPFIDRIMSFYYADKRVSLTLLPCLSELLSFMCL